MRKQVVIFYVASSMFAVLMMISGMAKLTGQEAIVQATVDLGYPLYLLKILGTAYLIGAIAILQSKFETLKQWGYAGFSIALTGAAGSHLLAGQALSTALPATVLLAVLAIVVTLNAKLTRLNLSLGGDLNNVSQSQRDISEAN
ncbi:DoxX family protein [Microbulbifer sp. JMSA004]|uniref:DoxX family protein n=1 Tax=unclassified Microbulbifer TaxID=2619833 RepID=UPI0024AD25A4|nr:DoxX family protein [Microbulbifer sp. VAAF005]WHI48444.1 DoxX family protein [Microbulbifer sp. VAAF005]